MKNRILQTTILFICFFTVIKSTFSQTKSQKLAPFGCGTDILRKKELRESPKLQAESEAFETFYRDFIYAQSRQTVQTRGTAIYTIPVVFHIFHQGEALGDQWNPTDEQIQEGLNLMNNNFKNASNATFANNPFSGVDMQIEFCLAQRTPNNTATTGIERFNNTTFASPTAFSVWDGFSSYLWDATKYCNIFMIKDFPPDLPNVIGIYMSGLDVVTIRSYLMITGSNAPTHELGHYFSLAHPFTGSCPNSDCLTSGDRVCDTPPRYSQFSTNDCINPANSCSTDIDDVSANNPFRPIANGGLGDVVDSYENYMDYTACQASFTQGQKARVFANIAGGLNRPSLVLSNACMSVLPVELVQFSAKTTGNQAIFNWQTATETNVKNFDIEKSLDSQKFEKIAEVKAHNTPSVYQAFDNQFSESAYYRLKINDLDGTSSYSKTVFLEKNGTKSIKISRNTEGGIFIETDDIIESVIVTNNIGQVLKTTKDNRFGLTDLPTGIYIISVKTNKAVISQKVLNF